MKPILILLLLAPVCLALTPKERELVVGITKANEELRANLVAKEQQIEADATTAVFAAQKIESLTSKLVQAKVNEEAQLQDLLLQQTKIHELEADRDSQKARADSCEAKLIKKAAEAHRNAVERDIGVFLAATFGTILIMSYAAGIIGWIVKLFPTLAPYGLGLEIALAIFSFAALFGAARGALALIASKL